MYVVPVHTLHQQKTYQKTEVCGLERYSINLCCHHFAVVLPSAPAHPTVDACTVVFSCYFFTQFKHMKCQKEPLKSSYLRHNTTCFLFQNAIGHPCFRLCFRMLLLYQSFLFQVLFQNTISHPCFRFCFRTLSQYQSSLFQILFQNTISHPCFRFCFRTLSVLSLIHISEPTRRA